MDINQSVNQIVQNLVGEIKDQVNARIVEIIQQQIIEQIGKIDFRALFNAAFSVALERQTFVFPDRSIPASALDSANVTISGNQVSGGIIQRFGSTLKPSSNFKDDISVSLGTHIPFKGRRTISNFMPNCETQFLAFSP